MNCSVTPAAQLWIGGVQHLASGDLHVTQVARGGRRADGCGGSHSRWICDQHFHARHGLGRGPYLKSISSSRGTRHDNGQAISQEGIDNGSRTRHGHGSPGVPATQRPGAAGPGHFIVQ